MEILGLVRQIVAASKTHASSKPEADPDFVNEQGFEGDTEVPVFPAEGSQPQSQAGAPVKNNQRPVLDDGPHEPDRPPIPPQPTHATPHGLNESYYDSFLPSASSVRGRQKSPPNQTSSTSEVVFPLPRPAPATGSVTFPLPHPHHNAPTPPSQAQPPGRPPPFYPHPPALPPWNPYYPPAWPLAPTWGVPTSTTMHSNRFHPLNIPHGSGQHEPFSPLQNPWDSARPSAGAQNLRPHLEAHGLSLQTVQQYKPVEGMSDDQQSEMGRIGNHQAHQGTAIQPSMVGASAQSASGRISQGSQSAATRISNEGAPFKDTPTWSKCSVSLATCIGETFDVWSCSCPQTSSMTCSHT
jgi:hypothetical protein